MYKKYLTLEEKAAKKIKRLHTNYNIDKNLPDAPIQSNPMSYFAEWIMNRGTVILFNY